MPKPGWAALRDRAALGTTILRPPTGVRATSQGKTTSLFSARRAIQPCPSTSRPSPSKAGRSRRQRITPSTSIILPLCSPLHQLFHLFSASRALASSAIPATSRSTTTPASSYSNIRAPSVRPRSTIVNLFGSQAKAPPPPPPSTTLGVAMSIFITAAPPPTRPLSTRLRPVPPTYQRPSFMMTAPPATPPSSLMAGVPISPTPARLATPP